MCEPGGVFVSGAAFEHVRGRVDAAFVDLGEKSLKNIARPMRVYAVKTGSQARRPLPTPPSPRELHRSRRGLDYIAQATRQLFPLPPTAR